MISELIFFPYIVLLIWSCIQLYFQVWKDYFPAVDAIVFLIDCVDRARFPESKVELDSLLTDDQLSNCPVVILGNKVNTIFSSLTLTPPELNTEQYYDEPMLSSADWYSWSCFRRWTSTGFWPIWTNDRKRQSFEIRVARKTIGAFYVFCSQATRIRRGIPMDFSIPRLEMMFSYTDVILMTSSNYSNESYKFHVNKVWIFSPKKISAVLTD